LDHVGDGPVFDEPPVADDREDVGGLFDLTQLAATDENSFASRGEVTHELTDFDDAGRIETVRRLVEHDHVWVAEQRCPYSEPLLHAERVRAETVRPAVAQVTISRTSSTRPSAVPATLASILRFLRPEKVGKNFGVSTSAPT
jgi:hypothetical protein